METPKFESYALIELFGHTRMAGKVTEQAIGGSNFIRVDVPETTHQGKFTRLLNPSAIYAINPITEEVAHNLANQFQVAPIDQWDIQDFIRKEQDKLDEPTEGI
ncbi:hypothetical protein DN752_17940 [Echinicola strongylocentroti]|uniref:Uncharacterized protein n=1 Tax=Echinicola strongylocentroti TaxID=1795355 RepID=A0A2Z4IL77_9BACT|nr:hypothetical protein [Echinicola strongylocentroti]AWW31862.1 hypothetical protein DN752_17940 [Echinicola strongylocentroti]